MKRRGSLATVAVILASALLVPAGTEAVNYSLGIPSKISQPSFNKLFSAVQTGIDIYKLDALSGSPRSGLTNAAGEIAAKSQSPSFDIDRIDLGKKGWTRYYPFSIDGEDFIIRIFLTEERPFQPEIPEQYIVLEGAKRDIGVTYQVFSGINSILEGCSIKPHAAYDPTYVERCP